MLVSRIPEATWVLLPHEIGVISEAAADVLIRELSGYQALLLGPGFGQVEVTRKFIHKLLGRAGAERQAGGIGFVRGRASEDEQDLILPPCVVDADGLKLLSQIDGWEELLPEQTILTPHPGEMSVMTGLPTQEIQSNRIETARDWAAKWNHIVVLKGAFTVVAAPTGEVLVLPFAAPALATAGTGDVLAGAIAGMLAQGLAPFQAAAAACWLHGRAGEIAAEWNESSASVIAGDLAEALIAAFAELEIA